MTERIINIELTPETVKDYYFNSDYYSTEIKNIDFKFLIVFIISITVSVILSTISFNKFVIQILILFFLSIYSVYKFLSFLIKRWKWLKLIESMSTRYKDLETLYFKVNDQGLGFSFKNESNFHTWDKIKSYKLKKSYISITHNDHDYITLPLIKVDNETLDFITNKLNTHGAVKTD